MQFQDYQHITNTCACSILHLYERIHEKQAENDVSQY